MRVLSWVDLGNYDSFMEAGQFVQTIEHRQGLKVACLEEIGFKNGWLSAERLQAQAESLGATGYGQYLHRVLKSEETR